MEEATLPAFKEVSSPDIRSTCTTFRRIANQLPFWHADDFCLSELGSYTSPDEAFVKLLLADTHLRECLSLKRSWLFFNPRILEFVRRTIPHFSENVRSLKLQAPQHRMFRQLAYAWNVVCWGGIIDVGQSGRTLRSSKLNCAFTVLTSLEIISGNFIHLNQLPPSLRVLRLAAPLAKCNCTNKLLHLEHFDYFPIRKWNEHVELKRFLPFKSKPTLTRFHLVSETIWSVPREYIDDIKLVIEFVQIVDLAIKPFTTEMCQILVGSPLRLKSFSIHARFPEQPYVGPLLDLLTSPVLGEVAVFRYNQVGAEKWDDDAGFRLEFETIIHLLASIPTLEELDLGYPVDEDWFEMFRTCTSLRKIVWDYSHFPTDEVPYHFDFEDHRLTEALAKILRNLGPTPDVEVHSRNRPERGVWLVKKQVERKLRAARGLSPVESSSESEFSSSGDEYYD